MMPEHAPLAHTYHSLPGETDIVINSNIASLTLRAIDDLELGVAHVEDDLGNRVG